MIFDTKLNVCFLANTKTGSTTIEKWVPRARGRIHFARNPYKHTNYRQFANLCQIYDVSPDTVQTICVVRSPFDKMRSWYKYRNREQLLKDEKKRKRSLQGVSFEEYCATFIEQKAKGRNNFIFSDRSFLVNAKGEESVTHVFRHDDFDRLISFLQERFDIKEGPNAKRNVSPDVDVSLSEDTRRRFDAAFAEEIAWYENLPRR